MRLIAVAALFATFPALAQNTVTFAERQTWNILRGTTTAENFVGDGDGCRARMREIARADRRTSGTVNYRCQTERLELVATYGPAAPPPPAPVDCIVGDWQQGALVPGTCPPSGLQSRTDTRAILTQPANGGAACPTLTQTLAVQCTPPVVDPPPPPPPPTTGGDVIAAEDYARIPWHSASGAWGERVPIEVAQLPNTTRTVNVSTREQFNAAAAVNGTRINVTAGWAGNTIAVVNASDVDVFVPYPLAIGAIEVGAYPRSRVNSRIRISGGGRMGGYRDVCQSGICASPVTTDVTIDGMALNGDSAFGAAETNAGIRTSANRITVRDSRVIASGYTWLGDARHAVIVRSNFFHGASTRASVGWAEGWGVRNLGGPVTILDSRIEGTRYNNLRVQPRGPGDVLYVARTTFVNLSEGGRVAYLWDTMGNNSVIAAAAVLEDNAVYSHFPAGCVTAPDMRAPHVRYTRVNRNRFFSSGTQAWSQATLNSQPKLSGGNHDWTGNTFAPLTTVPAWSGPGDPTQIPLPLPAALRGEGSCLAP